MTRELLEQANKVNHQIIDTNNMISIIEDMLHCDCKIHISAAAAGDVTLDEQTKLDVIDIVLRNLNNKKDELEDQLRRL